jgi:hypothetical protein
MNVTSLPKRINDLNSLADDAAVCVFQEAGITAEKLGVSRTRLNEIGWPRLLDGQPSLPALRSTPQGHRPYRDSDLFASGGVASVSRGAVMSRSIIPPDNGRA